MGNENKKNIIDHGRNTRFGQKNGADPRDARAKQVNPSSIRTALRRLMARQIDVNVDYKKELTLDARLKFLADKNGDVTEAMIVAAIAITQAVQSPKAMQHLIDQVDGKLIEKQAQTIISLADLVAGSFEDLDNEVLTADTS